MSFVITPKELKARIDKGDKLVLLDVREPWENQLAKLDNSTPHSTWHVTQLTVPVGQKYRNYRLLPSWDAKRRCHRLSPPAGILEREEFDRWNRCLVNPS